MSCKTITVLFSKKKEIEPPAILQCNKSGEYLPFYFFDWRDAIHYIQWCEKNNKNNGGDESFDEWKELYGYDEEEKFQGDLNEFKCKKNDKSKWEVSTTLKDIKGCVDLYKKSAWNM